MKSRLFLFVTLISIFALTSCMSQQKASYPVANLQKKSFGFNTGSTDRADREAKSDEAVTTIETTQPEQESAENSLPITELKKKDINTILIESQQANTLMEVRDIVLASSAKKVMAPFTKATVNKTPVDTEVSKAQEKISKYSPLPSVTGRGGSGFAIVSFIAGILGLLIAGIPLGIIAVIFGAIGLNRDLRGLAVAGIILGFIDIIGALIVISSL